MVTEDERRYKRGGPTEPWEAIRRAKEGEWFWRTADGRYFNINTIEDGHLVMLERFLLGRAEIPINRTYQESDRRRETYERVRAEIDKRGLTLLEEDGAGPSADTEDFYRENGG